MLLALLAVVWAVVLVPPLLRARAEHRAHSIGEFSSRLHALHRTNVIGAPRRTPSTPSLRPIHGAHAPAPRVSPQTVRRRREVLFVLGAAAIVTFLVAFKLGGLMFWGLHLLVDVAIGVYLYALAKMAAAATMRESASVRYVPAGRPAPEYAYRRSANY